MSRSTPLVALAAVVALSLTPTVEAGKCGGFKPPVHIHPPVHTHPPKFCPPVYKPPVVHLPIISWKPPVVCPPPVAVCPPPVVTPPVCHCPPTQCHCTAKPILSWYFGMSLQRVQTIQGIGLQVTSVTPGSPASQAGLEPGDILLVAGSQSLQVAQSNVHGVALLQSAVTQPTPVAVGPIPTTTLVSHPVVAPQPASLLLTVIDARTGQLANVVVLPQQVGAPVATAAPVALNLAQPTATL